MKSDGLGERPGPVQTPGAAHGVWVYSPSTAPRFSTIAPAFVAPGQTLEFRAACSGADEFENMGFGDIVRQRPVGGFGTGRPRRPRGTFFARTITAAERYADDTRSRRAELHPSHLYRIEWAANDVKFFIDGAQVADHAGRDDSSSPMRPVASDLNSRGAGVRWSRPTG